MSFARIPILAVLVALLAIAMLVPMTQATIANDWRAARSFLFPAIFCLFAAGMLSVLLRPIGRADSTSGELVFLVIAWFLLPFFACLPLIMLTPSIGRFGAYFEMLSALTTTGGTIYRSPLELPASLHLWRGIVGWLGGLMTLMGAYVILAPRQLGGFEVNAVASGNPMQVRPLDLRLDSAPFRDRLWRALRVILPVYMAMTLVLAVAFSTLGARESSGAIHAMSIVSTSGISPYPGGIGSLEDFWSEALAMAFMVLAASRVFFRTASQRGADIRWYRDPELRLMGILVCLATFVLFARHWVGVLTIDVDVAALDGFEALWGALFTSVSFITTTGFQSFAWESARDWSGLANPGLVLLGLCVVGGSAATTAGGIKLIRAYALIRHGMSELERIARPHSVAGLGSNLRGIQREGAFIAWAFFMLFILALLTVVLGLTLAGMAFDDAFVAAVAALSNTGPLFSAVSDSGTTLAQLQPVEHAILGLAMVLGRIETLAVILLFNPDTWRSVSTRTKNTGKMANEPPDSPR